MNNVAIEYLMEVNPTALDNVDLTDPMLVQEILAQEQCNISASGGETPDGKLVLQIGVIKMETVKVKEYVFDKE